MTNPIDPKDILDQADDLLADINQANFKFVNQTNQTIKSVNQSFKKVDKLNADFEKAEQKTLTKITEHTLGYLARSE